MKELGKYLIPFIVLVFVIHNKAHCQFLHHAVTLMQAYSYEKYDSLSHSKLKTLYVQLNRETLDFMNAHKNYSVSDFTNLQNLFVESHQGSQAIAHYPVEFINNLTEDDTKIFQDWLNGISELDSIKELTIPSFFKIGKMESLSNLNVEYYKYFDSSLFHNFQNVKELRILSSSLKNESIDFDFSNFKKLERLSLSLYSEDINSFNLPDLKLCHNLNRLEIYATKSDSLLFKGLLYGSSFLVHTNELKFISFDNVTTVDDFRGFTFSGRWIDDYDFTGLNVNSDSLRFFFTCNTHSIDFDKFPKNQGYERIYIDSDELTEILFPSASIKVKEFSLTAANLEKLTEGLQNLEGITSVFFITPKLDSLADDLYRFKELESLTIYRSNLNKIPDGIENMPACIKLEIYVNKVRRSDLKRLEKLKTLRSITIYQSKRTPKNNWKLKHSNIKFLKKLLPSAEILIYK